MDQKFFKCNRCGNIVAMVKNVGVPLFCCGEKMVELVANTVEASAEKHIPAVKIAGEVVTVQVGSIIHPMEDDHHIAFIYLQTENGGQMRYLKTGNEPVAEFNLAGEKPVAVFEYCNIHGLWKIEL